MPIRKAGRWVVTVSLDHEALEVYQSFTKGTKSAKVCSALILYNVNQKKNRNESARQKLLDRAMLRLKKDLKVANYRIESIQRGDNDPGSAPAVYFDILAAEAKEETRAIRGGRF